MDTGLNQLKLRTIFIFILLTFIPLLFLGCNPKHPKSQANSIVSQNENATAAFNLGMEFYNQKKYDQALEEFTQAIQLDPKYTVAYNLRGSVYYIKKEFDQAIVDYSQAIALNPYDEKLYNNRAMAYIVSNKYDAAITDCDTAIQLNPTYAFTHNNRGWAFYNKGEYRKAIPDFTQAIKLDPKYALAVNNRGMAYEAVGNHDQAMADYNQAIQLDANFSYPYYNRGNVHKTKGEYDLAISDFNQAISINPNYLIAYIARGSVYITKSQYSQAIKDLLYARRLNRDVKTFEQIHKFLLSIPDGASKVNNPYNLSLKSINRKNGLVSAELCFNLPSDNKWILETFDGYSEAAYQVMLITEKDTFEVVAWNETLNDKTPKKGDLTCEPVQFQPPDSIDLSGSKIIVNKLVTPIPEQPDCKKVQGKMDQMHPGFVVGCADPKKGESIGLVSGPGDISQAQAFTYFDDALHDAVVYGPWIFPTGLSK